jgi:hypothetical protein
MDPKFIAWVIISFFVVVMILVFFSRAGTISGVFG